MGATVPALPHCDTAARAAPIYTARVRIAVLGPVQAVRDGADLDLGPHKQRALLAGLVLHAGRAVPVETLIDLLWGDAPPAAVQASLHGYVAALRRILEPGRAARSGGSVLVTRGSGYLLEVPPDAVDGVVFTRRITDAHRRLGGDALTVAAGLAPTDLEVIDEQLAGALALWRGEPYPEVRGASDADAERARLAELRSTAEVDRGRIGLAAGRPAEVAAALTPVAATVLRLRRTASAYLAERRLARPEVQWEEFQRLQKR
jgi:DNA-binding winged helix-turn-helix (wHTH) protein